MADWITSKDNPLTARVIVNRIWLKLLGEGIVPSPNNWGLTGQEPTHPELLDLLAIQFMQDGWSFKKTIRKIVLSQTYRRSSKVQPENYNRDPENYLLWRFTPRPLDAEALRDAVLAIGGGLDTARPYGSQVADAGDKRIGRGFNQSNFDANVRYRSVYLPILRDDLPEALALFDFADPNLSKPKREPTNVPSQALDMMNNPMVIKEAATMAKELAQAYPGDKGAQVRQAFLRAFGRLPDEADMEAAKIFYIHYKPVEQPESPQRPRGPLRRPGGMFGGRPPPGQSLPHMGPDLQTLAIFCQSLMASAEFRLLN